MKKWMLYLGMLLLSFAGFGQQQIIDSIKRKTDSLYQLLEKETDPDQKARLVVSFYHTGIDGFPLVVLDLGQKLLALGREKNDPLIESAGWSALAQGNRLTGNNAKALELHQQAVALAERSGIKEIIGLSYNQMGHVYKDRLENEKALELYHTAMYYARSSNDPNFWFPQMNLAIVYLAMRNLDSALYYSTTTYQMALSMGYISLNNTLTLATIGSIYSLKGDAGKAWKYFNEAVDLARGSKSPRFLNSSYVSIAEHYHRLGMSDSAAYYNKMAIDAVQNTVSSYLSIKPARMLIDYYQNKNADSAMLYWRIFSTANDSLNNTRANQQIQMLTFDRQQRQWEMEQARKDYRAKWQKYFLVAGLVTLLLVLALIARANRRRKKNLEQLATAYSHLRATQQQLIQSEKMASLGELTAGIAHEIQNPLNFVNNFSELNTELIGELKQELATGNWQLAKELADNIRENEEKISQHGKRADAIVKGMLQHSRSSSGHKELTDINALCEEYLRLAYHGLRAKDKSFNAKFEADLDPSIEKINILPQDMGRVILNLINNAFYAVNERKKNEGTGYEPTVTVLTRKVRDKVEIRVHDNGTGIPQPVIEKIFQPFFTTKPTGQGTGLGLSLSYDIVTKGHGGELQVSSEPGKFTQFTILIPV